MLPTTHGGIPWSICLPTTYTPWVYLPTVHCTGVPGHDVHYARCPGGEALGSNLEIIRRDEAHRALRTSRVLIIVWDDAQSCSVSLGTMCERLDSARVFPPIIPMVRVMLCREVHLPGIRSLLIMRRR